MNKFNLLNIVSCVIGILLIMGGITFKWFNVLSLNISLIYDWLIMAGLIFLGVGSGYLLLGKRFVELTIPVSKYSLRKREDIKTLFETPIVKGQNVPSPDSSDPYSYIELQRTFSPMDYHQFSMIQAEVPRSNAFHHYEEVPIHKLSNFLRLRRYS